MQRNYKFLFICYLFFVYFLSIFAGQNQALPAGCLGSTVLAQTPTDSPEEAPTPEATEIDDEKIRQIRDQVREKIQEKIQEIKEKGKLRGYVGKILSLDGLEISLETRRGEREITVDEEANIIGSGRKKIDLDDLEIGDTIICMGSANSAGEMITKRIVLVPKPSKPSTLRQAVFGKVDEISQDSLVLSPIHPQDQFSTLRVEKTSKTRITKKLEGLPAGRQDKIQEVDFSTIEVDDRLIAIGAWDEDKELLTAKLIHVIPGKVAP